MDHYAQVASWIPQEKWYFSEAAGRDIGVPATVDRLISRAASLKETHDKKSSLSFLDFELFVNPIVPRETLIRAYFFNGENNNVSGYDAPLRRTRNFVTELENFGSQKYGISPVQVFVDSKLIREYVKANSLSESFQMEAFMFLRSNGFII